MVSSHDTGTAAAHCSVCSTRSRISVPVLVYETHLSPTHVIGFKDLLSLKKKIKINWFQDIVIYVPALKSTYVYRGILNNTTLYNCVSKRLAYPLMPKLKHCTSRSLSASQGESSLVYSVPARIQGKPTHHIPGSLLTKCDKLESKYHSYYFNTSCSHA